MTAHPCTNTRLCPLSHKQPRQRIHVTLQHKQELLVVSQGLDASSGRALMGHMEAVTVTLPALQAKFSPVSTGMARAKML